MLELIDIGVNLGHRSFDRDRREVIERALAAGVSVQVITGTTVAGSRDAAALAETRPQTLYSTAGVHPHHAKDCGPQTIGELRAIAAGEAVVAIGECGLDFNRNFSPPAIQEQWFEAQLELAAELSMPVFLHERDASQRFAEILKKYRAKIPRAVAHCFTGTREELHRYLDLDLHLGITGWICDERRGKHLLEVVRELPLSRMMLETDAPFLYPRNRPARADRRNEPAFLTSVLEVVAAALQLSAEEVAARTTATAREFFEI